MINFAKEKFEKHREGVLYLFFGGLTTLVNWVASFIMKRLNVDVSVNTAVAWFVSVLFAYLTNRKFVFKGAKGTGKVLREVAAFYAARGISGVLDVAIMTAGVKWLGLWFWGVKFFSQIFVIVFNYFASKLFIFKEVKK